MNSGMDSSLRARVRCLVLVFCSVPGGVGVYPNLIAAGVLGPVQRHVGGREQLEQVVAVPFGDPVRAGAVGARQQHGELLAAEPAHHVGLADLLPEPGRHRPRDERTISLRTDMSSLQTDMPVRGRACRGAARMATL